MVELEFFKCESGEAKEKEAFRVGARFLNINKFNVILLVIF